MNIELGNGITIYNFEFWDTTTNDNDDGIEKDIMYGVRGLITYSDIIFKITLLAYELEDISIMTKKDAINYLLEIGAIKQL